MSYICVICTLNRPPLLPLAIEHRRLLDAIVSPAVDMSDLKACHLLLCVDCQVKMLSIHQFQKTAVQGIRNLKYLLSKVNHALPLQPILRTESEDVKSKLMTIKIEPETKVPAASEVCNSTLIPDVSAFASHVMVEENKSNPCAENNLKTEPPCAPEPVSLVQPRLDSGSAVRSESARHEPSVEPNTSNLTTKATQTTVRRKAIARKPSNAAKANAARYCARVLRSGVRKRYKINIKPKPLPCPHCEQKLSHAGSLRAHISRKHTEAQPSKCDECGVMCRNAESLRYHKYNHKKELTIDNLNPELFCAECAMHFPSRSAHETHRLALKHTPREQYTFECQVCQKKFPKDRTLRQHIDIQHLNLKKHKCGVCGKVYARGTSLKQHVRVVHEQRGARAAYICDLCGKSFKVKKGLTEHLLTHQGLRPYQCKLCPATFSYSAALYNHNNLKHLKKKRKKKQKKE